MQKLPELLRINLIESNSNFEVQRLDPTSPLHSIKSFEGLHLHPKLLKGVYALGFNAPSKIQETTLPILLANPPQNLIAQSQSGTGKTAAFVLAMLSRVNVFLNYPQILCLSPTYELAIQTGEVAALMSQFCPDIKLKYVVRGERVERGVKLDDHIIFGTPGTVLDWTLKFKAFDLKKITLFVLDEADVMIATQGHQDQSIRIHKQLSTTSCQMLLFSATYSKDVIDFAKYMVPNAITIRLLREELTLKNIDQYYVRCRSAEDKYIAITNIYSGITIGQAIIFCQTRKAARWLASELSEDGHAVGVLCGEQTVQERLNVLDDFRKGHQRILISTNVLSRGIDVEQVTVIVNFDMPIDVNGEADCETYLHRIGRTGRFGKKGIAINLIENDKAMQICHIIEQHFVTKIVLLDTDNFEAIEKIGS